MAFAWSFFGGRNSEGSVRGGEQQASVPHSEPQYFDDAPGASVPSRAAGSLDTLGQCNELVGVRFSQMVDRLEDLKSLSEDSGLIVEPIEAIAVELPQVKARILEFEIARQKAEGEHDGMVGQLAAERSRRTGGSSRNWKAKRPSGRWRKAPWRLPLKTVSLYSGRTRR